MERFVTVAPTTTKCRRVWGPGRDPYAENVFILSDARTTGDATLAGLTSSVRIAAQQRLRRSIGLRGTPPPACLDPAEAYTPVDGASRIIHGDLPSMLIGGVGSLLLQMLHPLAMAGVAQHSRYREDPLGRLEQTATFIGTTTFASRADAAAMIERVRAVHEAVRGETSDGTPYRASDPHLLSWVHVAELTMFLEASRQYGPRTLTREREDQYIAEMAVVGSDLGVASPPLTRQELDDQLTAFRPELTLTSDAREARDFVVRGVARSVRERAAYGTIVAAAIGILPPWARQQLKFPSIPLVNTWLIRPSAATLCATLRVAVPPWPDATHVN